MGNIYLVIIEYQYMDTFYLKKRGINNHETLPFAKFTFSEIFVPLHWAHVFEMPNLLLGILKKKYTCGEF